MNEDRLSHFVTYGKETDDTIKQIVSYEDVQKLGIWRATKIYSAVMTTEVVDFIVKGLNINGRGILVHANGKKTISGSCFWRISCIAQMDGNNAWRLN